MRIDAPARGRRAVSQMILASLLAGALLFASGATPALGKAPAPSRATVLQAQQLFHELGYPLGSEAHGRYGVRTRGALSYFQRKYRLPVSGYPNARTLHKMREVAAKLRGGGAQPRDLREPQPRDLVERVLPNGLPLLGIAAALALVLAALALSARRKPAQDSAAAEEKTVLVSGER